MKISRYRCFFTTILLGFIHCCTPVLYGQTTTALKTFSTDDGLSINTINALVFDESGFLWIGTADGLQRYDGYRFKTFKHIEGDKTSLSDNAVYGLYVDRSGSLWVNNGKTLSLKKKDSFSLIPISTMHPELGEDGFFFLVSEDENSLGIMKPGVGMFYIDKRSGALIRKDYHGKNFLKDYAYFDRSSIYIERLMPKNGGTWLMISDSLYHFHKKNITTYPLPKGADAVTQFVQLSADSLLMFNRSGLYITLAHDPFKVVQTVTTTGSWIKNMSSHPFFCTLLKNGDALITASSRLAVYNKRTNTIYEHEKSKELFEGNGTRELYSAAEDASGNFWLGFNGIGGIAVIPKPTTKFHNILTPKTVMPYGLFVDADEKIYCATFKQDFLIYNPKVSTQKPVKKIVFPQPTNIRAIAKLDSNTFIFKPLNDTIFIFDSQKDKLIHHALTLPTWTTFISDFDVRIQPFGDKEVLLNYDNRLLAIKKTDKAAYVLKTMFLFKDEKISSFLETPIHTWLATNKAIYDCKKEKKVILKFTTPIYVKHINEDKQGRLWLATTTGVLLVKDGRIIKKIDEKDGLKNSFVYSVLFDKKQNAWLSTNKGLAVVLPDFSIRTFTKEDGVQGDEFNTGCFYQPANGMLYYAGLNGITYFNPAEVLKQGVGMQVEIHSIEINNKIWMPQVAPESISSITLPHDQNTIKLSFGVNDFTNPSYNRFKIWMKELQDNWTELDHINFAQFVLSPGEYTLLIEGTNHEGVWSNEPRKISITILPAWYQTNLFKIVIIALLIALGIACFYIINQRRYKKSLAQLRLQQNMQQQLQLEKERLSRDLHDHLGSQLTLLINDVNELDSQQLQVGGQTLGSLKINARSVLQTLRQTIWVMHQKEIPVSVLFDKMIEYTHNYLKNFPAISLQVRRDEKNLNHLLLESISVLNLIRINQEAISNICKYSAASLVTLSLNYHPEMIEICIEDNGVGFDMDKVTDGSYGIKNMRERASLAKCTISIASNPFNGCRIMVGIPQSICIVASNEV